MARNIIERRPAADFADVQVYAVRKPGTPDYMAEIVWWSPLANRANCCGCNSIQKAMSSSCRHAVAVRRFAMKPATIPTTTPAGEQK